MKRMNRKDPEDEEQNAYLNPFPVFLVLVSYSNTVTKKTILA